MTADWDDTTNIRVPTPQHTEADDIRPDGATWGDCLVAGAKALAGEDHSTVGDLDPFGGEVPDGYAPVVMDWSDDPEAWERITSGELEGFSIAGDVDDFAEQLAGKTLTYDDAKNAAAAAIREEFPDEVLRG